MKGADISAVEGGILQHVGTTSGGGGVSASHVTIPGQVCCIDNSTLDLPQLSLLSIFLSNYPHSRFALTLSWTRRRASVWTRLMTTRIATPSPQATPTSWSRTVTSNSSSPLRSYSQSNYIHYKSVDLRVATPPRQCASSSTRWSVCESNLY